MSDDERKDLETIIDVGGTFHLRTWTSYSEDGTAIRAWCEDEFDVHEHDVFNIPMGVLKYDNLCLDCYYQKRLSTKRRFAELNA